MTWKRFALLLGMFCIGTPAFSDVLSLKDKPAFVPNEILVRFNDDAQESDKSKVLAQGISNTSSLFKSSALSNIYKVKLADGVDVMKTVGSFSGMSGVRYAQPNYRYYALSGCTTPTSSTDQYFTTPYNWPFIKIQAPQAWTLSAWTSCPGNGVTVAVLDTGVDKSNPDLTGVLAGYNEIGAYGEEATTCTCGCYGSPYTNTTDDFGHGTWVSGIIAATWDNNNGSGTLESGSGSCSNGLVTGMAGVAGGASILPIKVLDCSGSGYSDEIAAAIEYAYQHGAKVISMSLGGPEDPTEQTAVNAAISAGCVVVAASGNEYSNNLDYPAGYPGVLSVGASDENDNVATYSNGGTGLDGKILDLVAPGGSGAPSSSFTQSVSYTIFSTFVCPLPAGGVGDGGFLAFTDGNYGLAAGTSGATPFAAAAAALVFSMNPSWTNTQVIQQLINNTDSLNNNSGWDTRSGYGRLNVYKALSNGLGVGQMTSYVKTFNCPNPFYPDSETYTNITLVMTQAQSVQLSIYDTGGEMVLNKNYSSSQLNNNTSTPQFKSYYITWDGKNGTGQTVKTGVYFYTVNVNGQISHNKIVVIRGPK